MPKIPIILNYTDLQQQIALTLLNKVGKKRIRNILSQMESVEAFFAEKNHNLLKIQGLGKGTLSQINREEALNLAVPYVDYFIKNSFKTYFYQSPEFPFRLNQCDDAPLILFGKGEMNFNAPKTVAIVGTRNASDYGKVICDELISSFIGKNIVVVSGLAYGIDIYVHQLCVKHGIETIGVLGHGLDRMYPAIHKNTALQMQKNGGILTEFLPGTTPDRMNFPMRNRIVAGMCDATIVIESGAKGGSLITAELANDYNRDVFAFPGDIFKEFSKGCNYLIQQDRAHLITKSKDFFRIMDWENVKNPTPVQKNLFLEDLNEEEKEIVTFLQEKETASIDFLTLKIGVSIGTMSGLLLNLEFLGLIKSLPGKRYKLA
jgi:DNA processing protein